MPSSITASLLFRRGDAPGSGWVGCLCLAGVARQAGLGLGACGVSCGIFEGILLNRR